MFWLRYGPGATPSDPGLSGAPLHGTPASVRGFGIIHLNPNFIDDANGHGTGQQVNDRTTSTASGGVFRRLLSRLSGEKRVAILSKKNFTTALAPRVHRSMARGLRAAASASSSSTSISSTKRTATAQATESTRKLQAPLRVVLVQARVFRRLLSRLGGEKKKAVLSKTTFAAALTPLVHRPIARGLVGRISGFLILYF